MPVLRRKHICRWCGVGTCMFSYCVMWLCSVLHDQRLAHTDLKPENILFVDSDYEYCGTKRIHHKVSKLTVITSLHHSHCLSVYLLRVPMLPEKSWSFFLKFPGPGKSWKLKFKVLESPGIYLWFNITNMLFMYRTLCVNKCMKYLCCVLLEKSWTLL